MFAQFASKIFIQSMESVSHSVPQYRCFLKLLTKSCPMFCVKNLSHVCMDVILVELLLERLKIVVIQNSEHGKRYVGKKTG